MEHARVPHRGTSTRSSTASCSRILSMRSKSLRHESSKRRKCVALLALLTPAMGLNVELARATPGDTGQRSQSGSSAPALSGTRSSSKSAVGIPKLVPLSPQQNGNYGTGMTLIGPVSRSAGQPAAAVDAADDDAWYPRGSHPPLRSLQQPAPGTDLTPIETVPAPSADAAAPSSEPTQRMALAAPANDLRRSTPADAAARTNDAVVKATATPADSEPVLNVTDPEQNEPAGLPPADKATADHEPHLDEAALHVVDPSPTETDAADADADAMATDEATTESPDGDAAPTHQDASQKLEIRRLQLKNPSRSAPIAARAASNRSSARMSVGDMPLNAAEARQNDLTAEADSVASPRMTVTEQPIHGDRINAAGELILASGPNAANLPVLPQTAQLKSTLEATLRYYWERPEDAAERTHWGMMHSIMVWDKDTQIIHRKQRYNAVAWMAGNNPCRNQLLFTQDPQGINVRTGVGLQGHQAQLLAIFGLIDVPLDYPVYAGRQKYTVADILEREKLACQTGNELTFTLIALAHYADSDSSWVAADGQDWDMQRLLKEEMAQPIVGAACGGTHRLMGFAHALRRRRAEDKPIVQQWDRADRYVKEFVDYTWTLQNRDGSMSTAWFERSEDNGNMDRKIQTTGHMLEFLLSTVPDTELQSPRMVRTVGYLSNTMYAERGHQWQIGPKGHALRALALYYQRVFGNSTPWRNASDARRTAGAAPNRPVR